MITRILPIVALAAVAGVANAQLSGLGGIRLKAGYGWSGRITDTNNDRRTLQGPELGIEFPLTKLPLIEVGLTGDVLLGGQLAHGGDLDGNIYRFMLSGRFHVPGSQFSVFGGVGWATAQARGGQFDSFSGAVSQLGLAMPIGGGNLPVIAPSLEVAGTLASKSGLGGFSVSLAVRF